MTSYYNVGELSGKRLVNEMSYLIVSTHACLSSDSCLSIVTDNLCHLSMSSIVSVSTLKQF